MNFDDLVRYKALHLKYISSGSNVMEQIVEKLNHTVPMKNVCAMVSQELFDDLTSTCALLDISKRIFIEAAIIEALEKTQKIMEAESLDEHLLSHSMNRALQG